MVLSLLSQSAYPKNILQSESMVKYPERYISNLPSEYSDYKRRHPFSSGFRKSPSLVVLPSLSAGGLESLPIYGAGISRLPSFGAGISPLPSGVGAGIVPLPPHRRGDVNVKTKSAKSILHDLGTKTLQL